MARSQTVCFSPLVLNRPDKSYSTTQVPCGKCYGCLRRRQRSWTFRLEQEAKYAKYCNFVTFTYQDEMLPITRNGYPTVNREQWQNFIKRLRLHSEYVHYTTKSGRTAKRSTLKYYACSEYGTETQRPHYHAILYNLPPELTTIDEIGNSNKKLAKIWSHGNVYIGDGHIGGMHYVTKYMMKRGCPRIDPYDDREPEKSFMSKGLGKEFLTREMIKYLKKNQTGGIIQNGFMQGVPRYYKDKVYNGVEKNMIYLKYKSKIDERMSKPGAFKKDDDFAMDMYRKHKTLDTKRLKL